MLSIDISHAASFLSLPYEAALRPRLERAAGWLQNGGGKGSDFIGWVTLPRDYDKDEYARILAAAKKIQGEDVYKRQLLGRDPALMRELVRAGRGQQHRGRVHVHV